MVKKTGPTNPVIRVLVRNLRKASKTWGAPIWKTVAELIEKPKRQRIHVNISRINRYTEKDDIVVVPGKVLGAGKIDHPVIVAAVSFSKAAREKIINAGGQCVSINQIVKIRPNGSNVKIVG
ncbi:MAG: 50S ribosomal protein L18e [Thermoprotei archaeon]|jgi:large subunit ribosomal protein L18e